MRVAVFTDTYFPQINGVSNTLSKMFQYYDKKGIDYKVFAPKYETDEADYEVESFYSIKFLLYPDARVTFPNFNRINATLDRFKPDVVHNITEFNMGCTGMGYGKAHGVPSISNYTTNFSEYVDYYKLFFLRHPVWNWMKWYHNQNQKTLCPSQNAQNLLRTHGIDNTAIFSRGIDRNSFNPGFRCNRLREQLHIENKIAILYVGRVAIEKDMDILCKSYASLYKKYRDRVALVITGDGPYLDKCKQLMPPGTIFTGFKKGAELSEVYASSDIFVCPSSTETFGNVVLEAMASGLAVVGADAGGVGEIIRQGVNGVKFKKRNSQDLTDCLARLIEDSNFRNEMQAKGWQYAQTQSWDSVFGKLVHTFEDVIADYRVLLSS